jgi:hypothetical protein
MRQNDIQWILVKDTFVQWSEAFKVDDPLAPPAEVGGLGNG